MDMIGKVGRMKLRDQLSDGEICRRTGLAVDNFSTEIFINDFNADPSKS